MTWRWDHGDAENAALLPAREDERELEATFHAWCPGMPAAPEATLGLVARALVVFQEALAVSSLDERFIRGQCRRGYSLTFR